MNRIFILLDDPYEKSEKKWIFDLLKRKYGNCSLVPVKRALYDFQESGIKHTVCKYRICVQQIWKAVRMSQKNDVLIFWGNIQGMLGNIVIRIMGNRRKLVLLHWLTLRGSKWSYTMRKLAAENPKTKIIVNAPDSIARWRRFLKLKSVQNFYVLPDVYNSEMVFLEPKIKAKKYCFAGGMQNRNWKMIVQIAGRLKNVKFICVCLEKDFISETKDMVIPQNLTVLFQLPAEKYYDIMKNAYITLLPLKDYGAAGLINVCYSAQFGIPCISSKTPALSQYYKKGQKYLLPDNNVSAWCSSIERLYRMQTDEYVNFACEFQQYIRQNMSPQRFIDRLCKIIEM